MDYVRETKEYLRNYKNLKSSIMNMELRIVEINSSMDGIGSINYSGMPSGNYRIPDDGLANAIFTRDSLIKNLAETKKTVRAIEDIIKGMNKEEEEVLILSYIEEKSDEEIQQIKGLSRATLHRIRSKAIRGLGSRLFGIVAII